MDQDFYYRNLQFITLTNKKTIYQDSQYLLNNICFKKSTDFERIKKHVHIRNHFNTSTFFFLKCQSVHLQSVRRKSRITVKARVCVFGPVILKEQPEDGRLRTTLLRISCSIFSSLVESRILARAKPMTHAIAGIFSLKTFIQRQLIKGKQVWSSNRLSKVHSF